MPKSKRERTVHLTQTDKKNRDHKTKLINDVRDAIDSHTNLFLFSYDNMRSSKFKDVRIAFRDSKIFMGKNKLLQLAMGKSASDEYADNLRSVSKLCSGSVGLLMTSRDEKEVLEYFKSFTSDDFARAGSVASRTVKVKQEEVSNHPVSMIEQFRKLGLPVQVNNGKVTIVGKDEHQLCKKGQELTAEQCKALTHFGHKLATFKVEIKCRWKEGDYVEY
mmetsp:Transcript_22215/g.46142  ORF Transcript_22215/g.46142 Transcript_22215/m.46142 type:complete len:219 (-) Transcript_22215:19-675(-)